MRDAGMHDAGAPRHAIRRSCVASAEDLRTQVWFCANFLQPIPSRSSAPAIAPLKGANATQRSERESNLNSPTVQDGILPKLIQESLFQEGNANFDGWA